MCHRFRGSENLDHGQICTEKHALWLWTINYRGENLLRPSLHQLLYPNRMRPLQARVQQQKVPEQTVCQTCRHWNARQRTRFICSRRPKRQAVLSGVRVIYDKEFACRSSELCRLLEHQFFMQRKPGVLQIRLLINHRCGPHWYLKIWTVMDNLCAGVWILGTILIVREKNYAKGWRLICGTWYLVC